MSGVTVAVDQSVLLWIFSAQYTTPAFVSIQSFSLFISRSLCELCVLMNLGRRRPPDRIIRNIRMRSVPGVFL